jgi:hypothetical protein
MRLHKWLKLGCLIISLMVAAQSATVLAAQGNAKQVKPQDKPKESTTLRSADSRDQRHAVVLAEEVRHQLVTLPYYSVFDWLEANVTANGDVTLSGKSSGRLRSRMLRPD